MATMNFNIQPNVNNSNVVLAAQPSEIGVKKTMSSLEMAELAGRNHKDLLRSIRSMEAAWEKVTGRKFSLSEYIDSTGRPLPCYNFNYEESMYIASKFDDETRAKLTIRWAKLETGQAAPIYQQPKQEQLTIKDKMNAATWAAKFLNLNDASKLLMAQQILAPTGLILPEYTSSKGFLLSADKLLKNHGVGMTSHAFNLAMEDKGLVTYRERPSKSKGIKRFPILTNKGLKYGENQVHPKCQQQTQIRYYEDKFEELLKVLKLK
jgi:phage regulator Rha-like protein